MDSRHFVNTHVSYAEHFTDKCKELTDPTQREMRHEYVGVTG